MKQKRIEWVDCCKGLAIALVVLGHSLQEYMGDRGDKDQNRKEAVRRGDPHRTVVFIAPPGRTG